MKQTSFLDSDHLTPNIIGLVFISVILTVGAYVAAFHAAPISSDPGNWGQFGDYLGGIINPLLNTAVLVLLLRAVVVERDQRIEQGFFQLLQIHRELVGQMEFQHVRNARYNEVTAGLQYDTEDRHGRRAIQSLYFNLKNRFEAKYGKPGARKGAVSHQVSMAVYEEWYDGYQHKLGHYFRNIFQVLKYLATGRISDEKRKFLTDIFRAQLSTHEQLLLAYNGRSKAGEKMGELLISLSMLEHMDKSLFLDRGDVEMYPPRAYDETGESKSAEHKAGSSERAGG